jgi:hypothetical protein
MDVALNGLDQPKRHEAIAPLSFLLGRWEGAGEMITDAVVRTATAKEVTAGRRLYGLIGADLGYAFDMDAMGQPLQAHVSAQLKWVG